MVFHAAPYFLVQWYEVKRVIEEKSEEKRAETVM